MTEKLQKVLARAGLGSRREIERWIAAGRVTVNGEPATLGDRVAAGARLAVDGRVVDAAALETPAPRVLVYYKPVGEVTTRDDPEGRPVVFGALPALKSGRWIAVGRLDVNTSGLLLFTTDGELANRLMHPSYRIDREYAVRVFGEVTAEMLNALLEGVELEDGPARFERIVPLGEGTSNEWYRVILQEGRKRQVRRLWESQGATVSRLIRVRFGPVELPRDMRRGDVRELRAGALRTLYGRVGLRLPAPAAPAEARRAGRSGNARSRSGARGKRSPTRR